MCKHILVSREREKNTHSQKYFKRMTMKSLGRPALGCPAHGKQRAKKAVGMVVMATRLLAFEEKESAVWLRLGWREGRRNPVEL